MGNTNYRITATKNGEEVKLNAPTKGQARSSAITLKAIGYEIVAELTSGVDLFAEPKKREPKPTTKKK